MSARVGVDVGGTFTDIVLFDEEGGVFQIHKVLTRRDDLAGGILAGLRGALKEHGLEGRRVDSLTQGTTTALNAILEGKIARTGLVTNRGFRDLLEIGRERRPEMYNLLQEKPPPLVPRELRREVGQRSDYRGETLSPLRLDEVDGIVADFLSRGVRAAAVVLLHSYASPEAEAEIKARIGEIAPGLSVSTSHEVLSEYREYERLCLTILNASLMPVMDRYLEGFSSGLGDVLRPDVRLMMTHSAGGLMTFETARGRPIQSALSGPAAGVSAAAAVGAAVGRPTLITMDMGGTSCDVGLVVDGVPAKVPESRIAGYPVRLPMVDVHSIGAGGGSLAWIDAGGLLRVGPESAGADPGPACYGRGGERPTVTDANLALGRIDVEVPIGEGMRLDVEAARSAIDERVARPLGISVLQAAQGIVEIANAAMSRAIQVMSVERGIDPREILLVAYGGAGPLHAADIAAELRIPAVLVPRHPGLLSALGTLLSDPVQEMSQTFLTPTLSANASDMNTALARMEGECMKLLGLEGPGTEGNAGSADVEVRRAADVRYRGQAFTLEVALPGGELAPGDLSDINEGFVRQYTDLYAFANPERAIEIVNLRVIVRSRIAKPQFRELPSRPEGGSLPVTRRTATVGGEEVETAYVQRDDLFAGDEVRGPAVVSELGGTTVIPPGQVARVDALGNLMIEIS
ncbi:MAG: hydantoinase/oxoprolinase family protein [Nitrospinota bacterium]|nr:hydantoinase/oxoprolinase family protein [Nitrospinota bacterium]